MAIVQSAGALRAYGVDPAAPAVGTYRSSWDAMGASTYAAIYRTQPNVRTVIDFIARNIAQLGLHAYRRVSDLDRTRLADHELVQWIEHPNPATSRYRLIESLVQDLGIHFNAYWLKMRGDAAMGLLRLPPGSVTVTGTFLPTGFNWTLPDGRVMPLATSDVVYFNGYNPDDPICGLSSLETLRRLLAEDSASQAYRQAFWTNSARLEGVITRPAGAPRWTSEQKQAFREQWASRFAGSGNAGQTAVLDEGMAFTPTSYSARDSEFTAARKLTREEVAAAFHVPQPMVGILEHATFSNVKEQHKQLYQDCLGPWLEWIVEEIERQLLIDCTDQTDVYLEFNIADKLKGSFEEQAGALYQLVGRPVMTANEARARLNLSSMQNDPSADELAMPLNTSGPSAAVPPADDATPPASKPTTAATSAAITRMWMRQRAKLEKLDPEARAAAFDVARWDRELATDLEQLYLAVGCPPAASVEAGAHLAATVNADTLQLLVKHEDAFSPAREAALYV